MSLHPHRSLSRWLALASLAVYGCVGLFGHWLHEVLPGGGAACVAPRATAEHCCCCHHESAAAPEAGADTGGPRASGGDLHRHGCSLCALLAKIKVGYAAQLAACDNVEFTYAREALAPVLLPADLILGCSSRGPPRV